MLRKNNNGGSKRAYKCAVNVIKAFHDVNSILYAVTYLPVYSNCNHVMRNCKKQKIKS